MNKNNLVLSIFLALGANSAAFAETTSSNKTRIHGTEINEYSDTSTGLFEYQVMTELDKVKAKNWGLTDTEWLRYKELMAVHPRGVWTPDIDPITALGAHARTEEEMLRYAKMFVNVELERMSREATFEKVKNDWVASSYPDAAFNRSYHENNFPSRPVWLSDLPWTKNTKIIIYLDAKNCDESCEQYAQDLWSSAGSSTRVDVFVTGVSSDAELRNFAVMVGFPVDGIQSGDITINHDNGAYQLSGISTERPVAIQLDRDGQEIIPK